MAAATDLRGRGSHNAIPRPRHTEHCPHPRPARRARRSRRST